MNNDFENQDSAPDEQTGAQRPLGYWLRLVDGLISREFATAFEGEGVTRRDWMLLNALSGDVDAPGLAERLARKGGKRLRRLDQLGWAEEQGDGTWAVTAAGRDAKDRLDEAVSGIRSRVADAISPEDYATMTASLEAIARGLGWDETRPFPRGRGFGSGRGFGPGGFGGGGFGGPRPFRPDIRFGFGPNRHRGFEPGHHPGRPGSDPHHDASFDDAWGEDPHAGDGCRGHAMHEHGHEHGHGHGGSLHDQDAHGHPAHPAHTPHHGHEHGHGGHRHGHRGHRGHGARKAERAYERGFAAGVAAQPRADVPAADPAD
ncbi:UNVERIFIED_CONTAM: hypothetical protein OHV15_09670 [Microbacterium sp. SLM126]